MFLGGRTTPCASGCVPDRMAQLGVTTTDIAAAIQAQNAQYAAGKIGQEPAPSDQQLIFTVNAKGRLLEPEEFGNIILRADGPRGVLYLRGCCPD